MDATNDAGGAGASVWTRRRRRTVCGLLLVASVTASAALGATGCQPVSGDGTAEGPGGGALTDGGSDGSDADAGKVRSVLPGAPGANDAGVADGAPGVPSGTAKCAFTLSDATGDLPAVPASALGPTYPCHVGAFYDVTKRMSVIELRDGTSGGAPIPGSDIRVTWLGPAFDLLDSDLGTAPGLVMKSGASNTNAPLVGLVFSSGASRKTPVTQGFGNDWINPAVDPVHGPLQQGDWTLTLSSIVLTKDNFPDPNGDTLRLYTVSGTGTFHMIYDNLTTHAKATITVTLGFTDAFIFD